MNNLRLIAAEAAAILLAACSSEEIASPDADGGSLPDEAAAAADATIGCSNANFTATSDGGAVWFGEEGGSVNISVDCGVDWIAENSASDLFTVTFDSFFGRLTVTAGHNYAEDQLSGTVILLTSASRIRFATVTVTQDAYNAPTLSLEAAEWNAPAVGELIAFIGVESSLGTFEASSSASWLGVEVADGGVRLTAEENADTQPREAVVTVTAGDAHTTATRTIAVTQDPKVYLNLDGRTLRLGSKAGSYTIVAESNFGLEGMVADGGGWLGVSADGGDVTLTAAENATGSHRTATLTITAGDGAENTAQIVLSCIQYAAETESLVLRHHATSAIDVTLPIAGTVDCTVDWGDGTVEMVSSAYPSHRYAGRGDYDAWITGTVTKIDRFDNAGYNVDTYLNAVVHWGETGLTSMHGAFVNCRGLETIATDETGSFARVTDFYQMFFGCTVLAAVPEGLFDYATGAKSFQMTFGQCTAVETIPENLFANCPDVSTFSMTFYTCQSLTAIPPGIFAGHSAVTSFAYVFAWCPLVTEIPAGLLDGCTSARNFQAAFYNLFANKVIPEGLFKDCTTADNFQWCFAGNYALEAIPEDLFSYCPDAVDFSYVLYSTYVEKMPAALFDNNRKATDFTYTFCNNYTFTNESTYSVIDGIHVHLWERKDYPAYFTAPTAYDYCYYGCVNLEDYENIPASWGWIDFWGTGRTESLSTMRAEAPEPDFTPEI